MIKDDFCFSTGTDDAVKDVIRTAYKNKNRIRLWYGKDGKSWSEENDVCGYIGKSNGKNKVPLLVAKKTSFYGGAIIDDHIVKIVDTKTKKVLYQHPKFSQPKFDVITRCESFFNEYLYPGYEAFVTKDVEEVYARCKKLSSAKRLCDFMNGKRMSK